MTFVANQPFSKGAARNVERPHNAANQQGMLFLLVSVYSSLTYMSDASVPQLNVQAPGQSARPLSIQARRARRAPTLNLSMAGNLPQTESPPVAPSMSKQDTVIGDPITHRIRSSKPSAGPVTPRGAIITTVPVTTTEAPLNGGVLFVPPTRPLNVRRCTNTKTRRSTKGKKALASPPITKAESKSRNVTVPTIRVTKSNGEVDMDQYRVCALKLAGLPVD